MIPEGRSKCPRTFSNWGVGSWQFWKLGQRLSLVQWNKRISQVRVGGGGGEGGICKTRMSTDIRVFSDFSTPLQFENVQERCIGCAKRLFFNCNDRHTHMYFWVNTIFICGVAQILKQSCTIWIARTWFSVFTLKTNVDEMKHVQSNSLSLCLFDHDNK